jgi:hypothetical protein
LEKKWKYGISKVKPYVSNFGGVEYLTKCPGGPKSAAWFDPLEMSASLMTFLKTQAGTANPGRDPFAVELVASLRKIGSPVMWGDEVPRWKKAAA